MRRDHFGGSLLNLDNRRSTFPQDWNLIIHFPLVVAANADYWGNIMLCFVLYVSLCTHVSFDALIILFSAPVAAAAPLTSLQAMPCLLLW
jgi:hypothetical protein